MVEAQLSKDKNKDPRMGSPGPDFSANKTFAPAFGFGRLRLLVDRKTLAVAQLRAVLLMPSDQFGLEIRRKSPRSMCG